MASKKPTGAVREVLRLPNGHYIGDCEVNRVAYPEAEPTKILDPTIEESRRGIESEEIGGDVAPKKASKKKADKPVPDLFDPDPSDLG
jgi:hypothetical protein